MKQYIPIIILAVILLYATGNINPASYVCDRDFAEPTFEGIIEFGETYTYLWLIGAPKVLALTGVDGPVFNGDVDISGSTCVFYAVDVPGARSPGRVIKWTDSCGIERIGCEPVVPAGSRYRNVNPELYVDFVFDGTPEALTPITTEPDEPVTPDPDEPLIPPHVQEPPVVTPPVVDIPDMVSDEAFNLGNILQIIQESISNFVRSILSIFGL